MVARRGLGMATVTCTLGSLPMQIIILGQNLSIILVIAHKSARRRESDLMDACTPQILRCAQDDTIPPCHPERVSRSPERSEGEGSRADSWAITRLSPCQ